MTESQLLRRWSIHSRWRWLGITMFCLATPLPILAITSILVKGASWKLIFLSIGTLGLSLGSFGAANDTAVHALRELGLMGAKVPDEAELSTESERRPQRLAKVHDSPKAAFIIPILVVALVAYQITTLLAVWGSPS